MDNSTIATHSEVMTEHLKDPTFKAPFMHLQCTCLFAFLNNMMISIDVNNMFPPYCMYIYIYSIMHIHDTSMSMIYVILDYAKLGCMLCGMISNCQSEEATRFPWFSSLQWPPWSSEITDPSSKIIKAVR